MALQLPPRPAYFVTVSGELVVRVAQRTRAEQLAWRAMHAPARLGTRVCVWHKTPDGDRLLVRCWERQRRHWRRML